MQVAWNSCPHGNRITLLTPSTYSSRQTTHSTDPPIYLLLLGTSSLELFFSTLRLGPAAVAVCNDDDLGGCRDGWDDGVSGRDGGSDDDDDDGWTITGLVVVEVDWYVLTGRRSTTDFGALQRRRRIIERMRRSAVGRVSQTHRKRINPAINWP